MIFVVLFAIFSLAFGGDPCLPADVCVSSQYVYGDTTYKSSSELTCSGSTVNGITICSDDIDCSGDSCVSYGGGNVTDSTTSSSSSSSTLDYYDCDCTSYVLERTFDAFDYSYDYSTCSEDEFADSLFPTGCYSESGWGFSYKYACSDTTVSATIYDADGCNDDDEYATGKGTAGCGDDIYSTTFSGFSTSIESAGSFEILYCASCKLTVNSLLMVVIMAAAFIM